MSWDCWKRFAIGFDIYADTEPDGQTNNMIYFQVWPFDWELDCCICRRGLWNGHLSFGPFRLGWIWS